MGTEILRKQTGIINRERMLSLKRFAIKSERKL
jgi:hypothetical protein